MTSLGHNICSHSQVAITLLTPSPSCSIAGPACLHKESIGDSATFHGTFLKAHVLQGKETESPNPNRVTSASFLTRAFRIRSCKRAARRPKRDDTQAPQSQSKPRILKAGRRNSIPSKACFLELKLLNKRTLDPKLRISDARSKQAQMQCSDFPFDGSKTKQDMLSDQRTCRNYLVSYTSCGSALRDSLLLYSFTQGGAPTKHWTAAHNPRTKALNFSLIVIVTVIVIVIVIIVLIIVIVIVIVIVKK